MMNMKFQGWNIAEETIENTEFFKDCKNAGVEVQRINHWYDSNSGIDTGHNSWYDITLRTDLKTYSVRPSETSNGKKTKYKVTKFEEKATYRPDLVVFYSDSFDNFYKKYFSNAEEAFNTISKFMTNAINANKKVNMIEIERKAEAFRKEREMTVENS